MKKHKIFALLPMKANSQRVKGKNFRSFCGKPLYRWILDSLISIEEIDKIVINTDAEGLLLSTGCVNSSKVLIRNRKSELCGDDVSMNLILADDLSNTAADTYLMTHTTNPLLSASSIKLALSQFTHNSIDNKVDSLFAVNRVQSRFYKSDCLPVNHDPLNLIPTQNLEPWFEENSNLYIFTKESFKKNNARIGTKPMMFETPRMESIDIDTEDDWNFAEIAYLNLVKNKIK
jgi:CMP-N-acetylneuraminic acid synthetase